MWLTVIRCGASSIAIASPISSCARSATATRAPSAASSRTIPRPIPRSCAAPVTSATFPSRRPISPMSSSARCLPRLPGLQEAGLGAPHDLERVLLPERVLEVPIGERPVVREDLEVVPTVEPAVLERAEERRQVHDPVAGEGPVEVVPRVLAPVADVDARAEPARVLPDVLEHVIRVPEVIDVEEDSDVRLAHLVD